MNTRMFRYVEPVYPTRTGRRPSPRNYDMHVGYRAMWLTVEQVASWKKDRPFKKKIHDMVHLRVYHGDMVGQSKSWLKAAKLLEAKDVHIPHHRRQEWY